MKYKLVNRKTKKETLCERVTIDVFDYYVCDELPSIGDKSFLQVEEFSPIILSHFEECESDYEGKKVIATTNPNIDVPKVLDEVKELAKCEHSYNHKSINEISFRLGFEEGYKKAKETHLWTDEDMIGFAKWMNSLSGEELFQIWKEQQPKTIHYE